MPAPVASERACVLLYWTSKKSNCETVLEPYLYSFECVTQVGRMGENNGTRVSPNGEPAEIEPSKEVEQINDPSHPGWNGGTKKAPS